MQVGRRELMRLAGIFALAISGLSSFGRRIGRALSSSKVAVRSLTADDAAALQAMMSACVNDGDSCFGKCGEWSLAWAQDFGLHCPQSPLLTIDGQPMAFFGVPPIKPPVPAPSNDDANEVAAHSLREAKRT